VAPTTNRGQNSGLGGGPDCDLHIAYICAARNQAWRACCHAIPNRPCILISGFAGTKQVTFESLVDETVKLFDILDHLVRSSQILVHQRSSTE
jgi:hypothetical protein